MKKHFFDPLEVAGAIICIFFITLLIGSYTSCSFLQKAVTIDSSKVCFSIDSIFAWQDTLIIPGAHGLTTIKTEPKSNLKAATTSTQVDTAYHTYFVAARTKSDPDAHYMIIHLSDWHQKIDSLTNSISNLSKNLTHQKDAKPLPYYCEITLSRDNAHPIMHYYATMYALCSADLLANTTELTNFSNTFQANFWNVQKTITTTLPGKTGVYSYVKAAGGSGTQGGGWYWLPDHNSPNDPSDCCTASSKKVGDLNSKVNQQ